MDNSHTTYRGRLSRVNEDTDMATLLAYEEAKLESFKRELRIAQQSIEVMNLKKRAFRKRLSLQEIFNHPLG
ncbi:MULTISPECIES: hypothetical protein [unclassified Psychrobacter]|uniref:hypothetical protein n=1 Tax=Psychrobacter TaxID=497 RepID=UPI000EF048C4|nr:MULTISPECIES: hypothetical protein [unclassified Psychrobacter]HCI76085.1 hypothetical protein [Psychrobacter sp.]